MHHRRRFGGIDIARNGDLKIGAGFCHFLRHLVHQESHASGEKQGILLRGFGLGLQKRAIRQLDGSHACGAVTNGPAISSAKIHKLEFLATPLFFLNRLAQAIGQSLGDSRSRVANVTRRCDLSLPIDHRIKLGVLLGALFKARVGILFNDSHEIRLKRRISTHLAAAESIVKEW